MKLKKAAIAAGIVIALAIPLSVFAASSDAPAAKSIRGFFGVDITKLTDKQKSDINSYSQKMADLQKEFINKMVENGTLTKKQGDAALKRIDDMAQNGGGILPGFGMGGKGGFIKEHGDFGLGRIDTSKLTDPQKADFLSTYKEMSDEQKQYVAKMVSNGLLTKEQGDSATKKIDDIYSQLENNGLSKGLMPFKGGFASFDCFNIAGIGSEALTDQQKADLTAHQNRMAELQKQLIDKAVGYNLLTKEQGDAAKAKIDQIKNFTGKNGFHKGNGMMKGRPWGPGAKGSSGSTVNTPAAGA